MKTYSIISIDQETKDKLKKIAKEEDRTLKSMVWQMVNKYIPKPVP